MAKREVLETPQVASVRDELVAALQHCETASAELMKAWELCNKVRATIAAPLPVADKITDAQRGAYVAAERLSIIISRIKP